MPPIAELVQKNQQMQMSRGAITPPQVESPAPAPNAPTDTIPGLPTRGTFPPSMILHTDLHSSSRVFRNPQSVGVRAATFPITPAPQVISKTTVQAASVTPAPVSVSILLETNGLPNITQDILNLLAGSGITLTPDAQGGVTITSTASGDGLTHGTTPWESDPGYIILRDDFTQVTGSNNTSSVPVSGIGQLGWFLVGNTGSSGGQAGGVPPYLGQFVWGNSGTASASGTLELGSAGSNTGASGVHTCGTWALAENPGWQLTWVFKLEGDIYNTTAAFSAAKKSIYIGLCGTSRNAQITSNISARPDVFIGLRYDTSTTSPSISDSFYTLEVVANHSFSTAARHNTQGSTLVTNVAPVAGVWHRVDIICNTAGKVTITLDGSSTNTLTATIPTFTFTGGAGSITGRVASNQGLVSWTVGASSDPPESPWGSGSSVTVSGFSVATALNGTFTLTTSQNVGVSFDVATPDVTSSTGTVTVSGYPSLTPCCVMGNDDTAGPTANSMEIFVDYFSFVWNPNLGPSAPGSPDSTLPRYF